jgi:protein SCO1/2
LLLLLLLATLARPAVASTPGPVASDAPASGVGLDQHLGDRVPLELTFWDEGGHRVRLGQYFHGRPVILVLAYYGCPMLCTQVLNGLTYALQDVPLRMASDYEVLTVSIDPTEKPQLAALKKSGYVLRYGRAGGAQGWHFLTGDEPQISALAKAVGFRYRYDPVKKQYAHAAGIMIATPAGILSRYFYGVNFVASDVRLGLVDAGGGKVGGLTDQVLLLCYQYDPVHGRYGLAIMNVIRLLGALTLLGLGTFVWSCRRKETAHG